MEGMHSNDERGINVGENRLPIRSNGTVEFDVPSSFSSTSSVFMISSGRLSMSGFTIVLKKNIGTRWSFVYIRGGGSVILNSMSMNGGSLNYGTMNRGLLDRGSGSISCDNGTFENNSRFEGNGTIFDFTSLSSSFTLPSITFKQCRASNGYGGGVYVKLESRCTFTFSSPTFTSCSSSFYGDGFAVGDNWWRKMEWIHAHSIV